MINITITKNIIPNTATALNIFSGFLSILFASQGEFHLAAYFIFIAAFFDLIDGILARLFKTTSKFGVELDSLSDVVSFGVAPAYIIYHSHLNEFNIIGILLSSTLLVFGSFRLARFNSMISNIAIKEDFTGLPIPISAATISSFILAFYQHGEIIQPFDDLVIPLVMLLSILMVSNIRYSAIPKPSKDIWKKRPLSILFVLASVVGLIIYQEKALFYVFISLILFGIFRFIFNKLFKKSK